MGDLAVAAVADRGRGEQGRRPAAPRAGQGEAVAREAVRNLTGQLQPNGTLTVALPDGEWVVQRLGYSLTGKENSPANPEATGLEVDKLSATHVRSYLSGYLDPIQAALGPLLGTRGIGYVLTGVSDEIAELPDRCGDVDAFWSATPVRT